MEEHVIKSKVKLHYPEWKDVEFEELIVERMTGINNVTYKISLKKQPKKAIIFRIFGASSQNIFLDRQNEIYIYKLISQSGCGPKVYFYDEDIRIEQYLQSTLLPFNEMISEKGYMEKVAFTLRKFHSIKPNQTLVRESLFKRKHVDQAEKLITICQNKLAQDIYEPHQKQFIETLKKWISIEQIQFIHQLCLQHKEELVFSHHDLLANNILIEESTGNIIFIDYQYAGYNYRIADIANYFNETSFNYDITHPPFFAFTPLQLHNPQLQRFIQVYSVAQDYATYQQLRDNFEKVKEEEKYRSESKRLLQSLPLGLLLSDMLWCWWGIIVSKNPNIQFDYIQFIKCKYNNYQTIKSSLKK